MIIAQTKEATVSGICQRALQSHQAAARLSSMQTAKTNRVRRDIQPGLYDFPRPPERERTKTAKKSALIYSDVSSASNLRSRLTHHSRELRLAGQAKVVRRSCLAAKVDLTRGQVAQLVEHRTENAGVAGSIPALATSLRSREAAEA